MGSSKEMTVSVEERRVERREFWRLLRVLIREDWMESFGRAVMTHNGTFLRIPMTKDVTTTKASVSV